VHYCIFLSLEKKRLKGPQFLLSIEKIKKQILVRSEPETYRITSLERTISSALGEPTISSSLEHAPPWLLHPRTLRRQCVGPEAHDLIFSGARAERHRDAVCSRFALSLRRPACRSQTMGRRPCGECQIPAGIQQAAASPRLCCIHQQPCRLLLVL
jgi:hypothetical protein